MKLLLSLAFTLICFVSFGQKIEVSEEVLQSIKTDVWIPFMESYAELNPDKLKGVHSKDIIRIYLSRNEIKTGDPYLQNFAGFLDSSKERGDKVGIAFSILSTAIDQDETLAYQTGYYKFSSKRKDDSKMVVRGYGHFTVGLKKEDNKWKLWLDSDKRVDITDSEFLSQDIVYSLEN
nr:hypothetical protein [Allomuricauda sp.]